MLVHGRADILRDPEQILRALRSGLRPWTDEPDPMFVAVVPELISGRRLSASGHAVPHA